ncbi:dTDP-4-dehydrorhamnose reductase [Spongiibacter tropicus]|uniref:dTDP-4-dehydrorhamnose reductase n=1 Tax=Spongiibacter tropicus TaxID=454602 RepID=UPI0023542A8A|nr:dTDP-4-dehydrorhamnose reductase [Spongiibacter tropicus]|tara:strand:+ start:10705 stop:11583 length:879 start_codon:yes stop_codon:yes gene_type:complete
MRVLLTGANGQLGRCVQDLFIRSEYELIALGHTALDIGDADAVSSIIAELRPKAIINAAAYTAVDRAEAEPELAAQINTVGPGNLARAAEKIDALLIHISTDYVFDGRKMTPYVETDATNPQGVYGKTKLDGERLVKQLCEKHIILRTAWVFSEYGNNFMKTMLRLSRERDSLNVVADQIGCPTYAGDIAIACRALCDAQSRDRVHHGLYHYGGDNALSWHDFAVEIFRKAVELGVLARQPQLLEISSNQYPTLAKRPVYSVLDSAKFASRYSVPASDWKNALTKQLQKIEY